MKPKRRDDYCGAFEHIRVAWESNNNPRKYRPQKYAQSCEKLKNETEKIVCSARDMPRDT